jgi:dolichol-phosphate mannosyltransferase
MRKTQKLAYGVQVAVVIPTYNEAENIGMLLTSLANVAATNSDLALIVCVVDDSSPDGTATVARRAANKLHSANFEVIVQVRKDKRGLGSAYRYGFNYMLENYSEIAYVLQMDADFSHDPSYIPAFIALALGQRLDLVIGSRYIRGGSTPDWPFNRRLLSHGGNLYTRFLLGKHITDYTGGYNMYSSALLKRLMADALRSDGYSFQIEMKHRALRQTKHVAELPIVFKDRSRGLSKIPKDTARKTILLVLLLRLRSN